MLAHGIREHGPIIGFRQQVDVKIPQPIRPFAQQAKRFLVARRDLRWKDIRDLAQRRPRSPHRRAVIMQKLYVPIRLDALLVCPHHRQRAAQNRLRGLVGARAGLELIVWLGRVGARLLARRSHDPLERLLPLAGSQAGFSEFPGQAPELPGITAHCEQRDVGVQQGRSGVRQRPELVGGASPHVRAKQPRHGLAVGVEDPVGRDLDRRLAHPKQPSHADDGRDTLLEGAVGDFPDETRWRSDGQAFKGGACRQATHDPLVAGSA